MLNAYLYLFYPIRLHLARGFGKKHDEITKFFSNPALHGTSAAWCSYAKAELGEILKKLNADGVSILTVTHDLDFAASFADRCAMMFDGRVISADEPHRFFSGNRYYTTDANRIAGSWFPSAITCEEVVRKCRGAGR